MGLLRAGLRCWASLNGSRICLEKVVVAVDGGMRNCWLLGLRLVEQMRNLRLAATEVVGRFFGSLIGVQGS